MRNAVHWKSVGTRKERIHVYLSPKKGLPSACFPSRFSLEVFNRESVQWLYSYLS